MKMSKNIYSFLDRNKIAYQRFDHPAVYTVDEAERLLTNIPGLHIKNLLLRDEDEAQIILLVVRADQVVDLKSFARQIELKRLSFASTTQLKQYLGVEPGAVTLLGLMNDTEHSIVLYIDQSVWEAGLLQCHPLVNTSTLVIPHSGIESFLMATGHTPRIMKVPEKI